ncbi:MAG: hypothetical protein EPN51_16965 [Mycobacterium sp.]|nr:MAG: hypothetical protein EPN51_16965 [Mycobacterium sp.]
MRLRNLLAEGSIAFEIRLRGFQLRVVSNTATRLVNDTQADLVKNPEPTIQALTDVGPDLMRERERRHISHNRASAIPM